MAAIGTRATAPGIRAGARGASAAVLAVLLGLGTAHAEVTRVEILTRTPVLDGAPFGDAGPYEKLQGRIHFEVDPSNPRNRIIADLDKAPRNARGMVAFSSDLQILRPRDPARGNGVLLFDVVNRGATRLLSVFSRGTASNDPTTAEHFGDALLLREGYTLVAVGWQFDVPAERGLLGLRAPIATENGRPIRGWVRMWVVPDAPAASLPYATASYNTTAYPPVDPESPDARLTVREGILAPMRLIPREQWRFARDEDGTPVADPRSLWLQGGFQPGLTYEVAYETQDPPVAGLGLAALRDTASALRYSADSVAPGRYAYMYGASQTGRLIRHLVYEGFTIDEQERKAFDAAFIHTGGPGRGSFNERFAQPNELGSFTQTRFPILYRTTTDPVTGIRDGLGARIPAGQEPRLFLVDTSSEYWDRGRVAALRHVSLDGTEDVTDAPNVRVFQIAGTQHGSGQFPPNQGNGQLRANSNDYRWAQRGLLMALDAWVRLGTEPPPSLHPRLSDGTLVAHRDFTFPPIPGVPLPTFVPGGARPEVGAPYSALPFLVPAVDDDGNETGGIRLPEQAVPLMTLTGWQFRSERVGAPRILLAMQGAHIPLPATRADREGAGDPRRSVAERYASRDDYLARIRDAAAALARQRYVLDEDVPRLVERAGRQWDWLLSGADRNPW